MTQADIDIDTRSHARARDEAELTGAEAIAEELVAAGIETVFGIPGLYNMAIYEALRRRPEIRTVAVRHEQGAAFMADGYARASGREAACLLLPGCGVLNAMTGLSEAYADSSPVLLLATQVERRYVDAGRGLLHELTGQLGVVGAVTKHDERVEAAEAIPQAMRGAITAMRSGRRRPVQVEVPLDVQAETFRWTPPQHDPAPRPALAQPELVAAAARALAGCARPLVLAGGGVVAADAQDAVVALADRLGAPVLTTGMGVTSIPGDHPLACGVAWAPSADVRPLVAACDGLLAIGTRCQSAMTADWDLPLPSVTARVDVDPTEIDRNLPFEHRLVGDARAVSEQLGRELASLDIDRRGVVDPDLRQAQERYRAAHRARVGATRPWMDALRASLPRHTVVSADMSVFWADMLGSFPFYEPRTMLFPWSMGTLGFALPAAIGAKIARADRPVVAIAGDGAFLFTGGELATAVQERLSLPIVVVNNRAYGMIKMQQEDRYGEGAGVAVDLAAPDFVALAKAFGAHGELASAPAELAAALERALVADGPTVIEVPWGERLSVPDPLHEEGAG